MSGRLLASAGLVFACALILAGCGRGREPQASAREKIVAAHPVQHGPVKPQDVVLTTLASVPGKSNEKTTGFNCRMALWDGHGNYADTMQSMLQGFQADAAKSGMNAVVNMRFTAVPFAQQGSEWPSSVLNLCGDEVTVN